jgi:hypothetical protein
MRLPDVPTRLNLHAISMHLLWAKTSWQNVQEEATEGCQMAHSVVHAHKTHHTVPVQTLRAYLAHIASDKAPVLENVSI